MTITIRKGKIGKNDIQFYTSASPSFSRTTSTGGSTVVTAVSATHIPTIQSSASLYFSQNTVQRALNEIISRYLGIDHSTATYMAGGRPGHHLKVMGFRNSQTATSIQAAASNSFLRDGIARVMLPEGTTTAATPINIPRKAIIFGNGRGTVIRASSTVQTSRVFSISGSLAATTTTLNAAGTINTKTISVSSTTGLTANQWIYIQKASLLEQQQIRSVSGNTLTLQNELLNTYASGGTVRLIYPAEITLDNFELQLTSATQGFGVSATYCVNSRIGKNVRIVGAANAGVVFRRSSNNISEAAILNPKAITAGRGYGVRCTDNSHKNEIDGQRQGVTLEVADGNSYRNHLVGNLFRLGAAASFNSTATFKPDPMAYIMRVRKPELSHTTYSVSGTATRVLTCPATSTSPAEVYINGNIYRNYGTILCDLSRTKTPATATVGGMDRGPATATRSYYAYAVPTLTPSATRQWDLVLSSQSPATGILASATYPNWSWLGHVISGVSASIRLVPFTQHQDEFVWYRGYTAVAINSPVAINATWKQIRASVIPVGAKAVRIQADARFSTGSTSSRNAFFDFNHGDAVNINESIGTLATTGFTGTGQTIKPADSTLIICPVNSSRFFAYRNATTVASSTVDFNIYLTGVRLDRIGYR